MLLQAHTELLFSQQLFSHVYMYSRVEPVLSIEDKGISLKDTDTASTVTVVFEPKTY